jgi:hypothetical protein
VGSVGETLGDLVKRPLVGTARNIWTCTCFLFLLLLTFTSCGSRHLHRPPQIMRVGPVATFLDSSETYLPDLRILVRVDDRGISVMSTECTVDLSPLELVEDGENRIFRSRFSAARYSLSGEVLSPPAIAPLPYFKARLAEGVWGGPKDTLFVEIGLQNEVNSDWRLSLGSAQEDGARR